MIGNNVEDMNDEGIDVATVGSSIITSKVSEIFSTVTSFCILDFGALEPLPERLNSLCKSCTCCRSPSFSLYCSSVPDLEIDEDRRMKAFDKHLFMTTKFLRKVIKRSTMILIA